MDVTSKPPETETPPPPSRPKPLSFANGALKRHHPPPSKTIYRECLKNHAAALGGHALDGCCEFMPSPLSSPSDPTSLKCAACGCHRNFHRRDDDVDDIDDYRPPPTAIQFAPRRPNSQSPPPYYSSAPHMLLALSTGLSGGPVDAAGEVHTITTPGSNPSASSIGRKRFRTKFTKEQKDRMYEFSERLGWRLQKHDEDAVEEFCKEIGVGKGVLKVWMHNNKNTFNKRDFNNNNINNNDDDDNTSNGNRNIISSVIGSDSNVDHNSIRSNATLMMVNGSPASS